MDNKVKVNFLDNNVTLPVWIAQYGYERCKSLHCFGPAVRDHYLLHFVVSGKGTYTRDVKTPTTSDQNYNATINPDKSQIQYTLKAGEGFLILPNNITTYTADSDTPWEYYWIGINGSYVKSLLSSVGVDKDTPCFNFEQDEQFIRVFNELIDNNKSGYSHELDAVGDFYKILSSIMTAKYKTNPVLTSPQLYLEAAVEYIRNNYSYDINVAKIARYVGIDRTYLYKIFINAMSLSPGKYIIETRLENAHNLLITTNYTILQIALSTGFSDVSHFSNSFKKKFGVSPNSYRKEHL